MNLRARRLEEPEINLVSLIDVVLMMVVFFMLSSSLVNEGRLHIRLPETSGAPAGRPKV
ncbi:MAG: ExbD/TolR family protein, partial [Steroidobacteraceae bacterium]